MQINLFPAYQIGWNTILIDPISLGKKPKYIDYRFKTIEEALLFFIVKDKFNKKNYK